MSLDSDIVSVNHPVLIRLPKGDMKITRVKEGDTIRIGKIKIPGMATT